eukprot:6181562-Pleurochrysis_carterae.AAC.3
MAAKRARTQESALGADDSSLTQASGESLTRFKSCYLQPSGKAIKSGYFHAAAHKAQVSPTSEYKRLSDEVRRCNEVLWSDFLYREGVCKFANSKNPCSVAT